MTIDPALLDPGERLLWSDKPNPLRYALKKGLVTFVFGFFCLAFAIYWVYGVAKQGDMLFALFGVPFLAVGLGLVLSPLWQLLRGARATYALTERRAVIDISGIFPRRISVPLGQIRFVELKRAASGFGDVLFREIVMSGGDGTSITRDGFIAVADADRVEQLLRTTLDKLPRTGGGPT